MHFDVLTIFPKIFDSYLNESILRRAREKRIVDIRVHNLRDFAGDKRRSVDDKPYGGGAGMVLAAEPILRAVEKILKTRGARTRKREVRKIVILSAKGRSFSQKLARDWAAKCDRIILISGRYEGIDERVRTALKAEEISIGPYVLTDGDVAAMVIVSAVTRLLPGVIKSESLAEESFNSHLQTENYKLKTNVEYPHYTRPEVLTWKGKKYRVPKVLRSGDHNRITQWRKRHAK